MVKIKEIWKFIPGFEGYYEASILGRIRNAVTQHVLTPYPVGSGFYDPNHAYQGVHLYVDGVRFPRRVHRLIALAFIPNPSNKPQVNHLDGDVLNNAASNLEWCTAAEDAAHAKGLRMARKLRGAKRGKKAA